MKLPTAALGRLQLSTDSWYMAPAAVNSAGFKYVEVLSRIIII